VKVPTIRYSEQIELLPIPPRTDGNPRLYRPEELQRLNFIGHSRELGFEIDLPIARLTPLRAELARMVDECGHGVAIPA
jgi:DNA-binding transcriptional MerR regulator